jgi:site-specific recombinase XerD
MELTRLQGNPPDQPAQPASDAEFVVLWLGAMLSPHTRRAYRAEIRRFLGCVQKPLRQVSLGDLQAFRDSLEKLAYQPTTLNRALTAIKSLLSFGHETGYLLFNVGAALKLRPERGRLAERILEESEVARLIERTPEGRDQAILKLFYTSGIRVSELCDLTWSDAIRRGDGGQITVFGKGGKTRAVLLKPRTWHLLETLRGSAALLAPIFRSRKGGGRLDPSQVRRILYTAAKRAGLEQKVSPHWLRHAHASHALDRSAPIHLVQATLGHSSIATTGKYLHARPNESSSFYLPD